jgi:predicted nucleotidyltransferase
MGLPNINMEQKMVKIKNLPAPIKKKGIEEKLVKICKENNVVFMAIFGSFVRGEQKKKSDIDIAIKYADGKRKSLFDLVELAEELKRLFGRKVDLGEFDSISPYVIDYVKKEMKIIYEKR